MKTNNLHEQLYAEANNLFHRLGGEAMKAFAAGDFTRERRISDLCDRALFRLLRRQQMLREKHRTHDAARGAHAA